MMRVKLNTFIGRKYNLVGEIVERDNVKVPYLTADIPAIEYVKVKWDNSEHGISGWLKKNLS